MKTLPFFSLSLALALAGLTTARSDTIHSGSFTADISKTGAMTAYANGNSITFGHESVNSVVPLVDTTTLTTGTMTTEFHADAGRIFDKVYFGGMVGGAIFNAAQNGAWADFNWTVDGGSFEGGATYGGATNNYSFAREWEITGPSTGRSRFYLSEWYSTIFYDFNNPVYGSGYYSIGASSFSIDMDAVIGIWNQGNAQWAGGIAPQGISFNFTYLDAPASPNPVPETGSTAGLMLLAFAGMVGVRRKMSRT